MSISELVKGTILKCLRGSQSWVHSQHLEMRPIKIRPVDSKTKLDPPKQVLIKASAMLGPLLAMNLRREHGRGCSLQCLFILLEKTVGLVV